MMKYNECAVCELRDDCAGAASCFGYTNSYGVVSDTYAESVMRANRVEFYEDWNRYIAQYDYL